MGSTQSIRYAVLGLTGLLVAGAAWLGFGRYQEDQRALAASMPAAVPGFGTREQQSPGAGGSAAPSAPRETVTRLVVVHVAGAVANPGVYRLEEGARVSDALAAAGGAQPDGVPDALNLAARVSDGDKVFVPDRRDGQVQGEAAQGATVLPVQSVAAAAPAAGAARKVRLNSATAQELDSLPGVTPKAAEAIVEFRRIHGPFRSLDDLVKVSGIGPATLEKIRPHLDL